jgi:antitoxin (DNA-binding transcriptional repressor) of toxin-antitoxin stability system
MSSVPLEQAQAYLAELIKGLRPGERVTITQDQKPIAPTVRCRGIAPPPRKLGTLKGTILYMAPDFDTPLEDFQEGPMPETVGHTRPAKADRGKRFTNLE